MATKLNNAVIELLGREDTTTVLATVNGLGIPHAVMNPFIQADDDGNLLYLELSESSLTQKNLVASIWFERAVAVSISSKSGESWQVKGRPIKTLITGPVFQDQYLKVRQLLGDVDLSAVWIIEPDEVINENILIRHAEEQRVHPLFRHLDRLVRTKTASAHS